MMFLLGSRTPARRETVGYAQMQNEASFGRSKGFLDVARNDTVFGAVVFHIAFPNVYGRGDFSAPFRSVEMTHRA